MSHRLSQSRSTNNLIPRFGVPADEKRVKACICIVVFCEPRNKTQGPHSLFLISVSVVHNSCHAHRILSFQHFIVL